MADHLKLVQADDVRPARSVVDRPEGRNIDDGAQHKGYLPHANCMDYYAIFWSDRFDDLKTLLEEIEG